MESLILKYALQVLTAIPQLIQAGEDVYKFVSDTNHSLEAMQLEGRDPTAEEWDTLNALSQKLRDARPPLEDESNAG